MTLQETDALNARRARPDARDMERAARGLAQLKRASLALFVDPRLSRALAPDNGLATTPSAAADARVPMAADAGERESAAQRGIAGSASNLRDDHHRAKNRLSSLASPGIFLRMLRAPAVFPRGGDLAREPGSALADAPTADSPADSMRNRRRLMEQRVAPRSAALSASAPTSADESIFANRLMNRMAELLKTSAALSDAIERVATVLSGSMLSPRAANETPKSARRESPSAGLGSSRAPLLLPSRLLASSLAVAQPQAGNQVSTIAASGIGRSNVESGSSWLAAAARALHRRRDAAGPPYARSLDSIRRAGARLTKRIIDIGSAAAYAGGALSGRAASGGELRPGSLAPAPTPRVIRRARAAERAGGAARPYSTPRTMRRAAASVALTAPLMLAQASARAFAVPRVSSGDRARLAAAKPPASAAHAPIVINYAPNLVIDSGNAGDAAALKRRVMDVLERHGRKLHQTLARELARQQRRDF